MMMGGEATTTTTMTMGGEATMMMGGEATTTTEGVEGYVLGTDIVLYTPLALGV
jgi:hypothetical protein